MTLRHFLSLNVLLTGVYVAPEATVETVEYNHAYHADTGQRRFSQLIYWNTTDSSCQHVADWHMADECAAINYVPGRTLPYTVYRKRANGMVQAIRAAEVIETHTLHDPEDADRSILPVEERRPLE